ncbi:MAG: DNA oxidative demethylase AlkB [Betaproteobacteria bacterium]|nr:DNA oxidative demethylase AlkB [Betaproteobacteria bacterium]
MSADLFDLPEAEPREDSLGLGAVVLRGLAVADAPMLLAALRDAIRRAPFRHMATPGGFRMSVAMTNCGAWGWVSDSGGYRYTRVDPENGESWPEMAAAFLRVAQHAASRAGFEDFLPDACLINRCERGARLSLHQDRNERDLGAPIVSISLGVPAVFLFGGSRRSDPVRRVPLRHGDVVVWGGPARLRYHGVRPLEDGYHPLTGKQRINLTFRRAA